MQMILLLIAMLGAFSYIVYHASKELGGPALLVVFFAFCCAGRLLKLGWCRCGSTAALLACALSSLGLVLFFRLF